MTPRLPADSAAAHPFMLWGTLALKTVQMSTAATQVIAIRSARMAAAGIHPDEQDQREMAMMGSEKLEAFTRSGHAIAQGTLPVVAGMVGEAFRNAMDIFQAATRLATSRTLPQSLQHQHALAQALWQPSPTALGRGAVAAARLAHRALAPVHETATANARRLARAR